MSEVKVTILRKYELTFELAEGIVKELKENLTILGIEEVINTFRPIEEEFEGDEIDGISFEVDEWIEGEDIPER